MTVFQSRPYQTEIKGRVFNAWNEGRKVVMPVLPTGSGKTHVIAKVTEEMDRPTAALAHRSELVGQMSVALAREGIRHRVIGSEATRRECSQLHSMEFGRTYVDPGSRYGVGSVDTFVRLPENDPWVRQIGLWIVDEGHHLLKANKWGKAVSMMPNAVGMAPTATPIRADGMGLGSHADGLVDELIEGPSMRWMIDAGYLTDYVLACPKSDIDLANVKVTESGDYSPEGLRAARRKSHITGDVVQSYLKFAAGKLAVVFDVDIENATETASAYRAAGIRAEVVHGKMGALDRASALRRFRNREISVLVNVDLFGEGVDIPAVECVIFARPTMSLSLYIQQFGRALRLLIPRELMSRWDSFTPAERLAYLAASDKPRAIIIDHVGNVVRHGLADKPHVWSLNRRDRRMRTEPDDAIPLRSCDSPTCNLPYERVLRSCPYCGHTPLPLERSKPAFVDGVLELLDPQVLAQLRGEAERIMGAPVVPYGAPQVAQFSARVQHEKRREAQLELQRLMSLWGGLQTHLGRPVPEAQARFFHQFRIDVATAQTLSAADASALAERITSDLMKRNVSV